MEPQLSVSELNLLIRNLLEGELLLQNVMVSGEITNMRFYGSTLYFELSDGIGSINAVMFDAEKKLSKLNVGAGLKVQAKGSVKFYAKKGKITFQANYMVPDGQGDLNAAFEALKSKLAKEGLFDETRKQPLPPFPQHVAIVTAHQSAAMWDFVSIMKNRMPQCAITVCPATVQGTNSPREVVAAINAAEGIPDIECLIVMRGGGSPEDLAGFNDESIVRRVAACELPVISAVGHEIDFTLCDFAADFRAPTPSAAAHHLSQAFTLKKESLIDAIFRAGEQLELRIEDAKERTQDATLEISRAANTLFTRHADTLFQVKKRLISANPLHKLQQGYSIVRNKDGAVLRSTKDTTSGDTLSIQFSDGYVQTTVN
ncbi:MAG: exodeoxyribonuclease VII large subunit [bacterium]|nr:exodeoxyribonuclease VII large subunit [bacterium]